MRCHNGVVVRALIAALLTSLVANASPSGQAAFDVRELAGYRLTAPVFAQFEAASRLIAKVVKTDAGFAEAPLFTREVALSDDVSAAAAMLDGRITGHVALYSALFAAQISSREYTKFAIALIAAHLAHEFLATGVIGPVPPGVAADNVAFVAANRPAVSAVLESIGVTD